MAAQAAKQKSPKKASSKRTPLSGKVSSAPRKPGVYIFIGPRERVLYVGKAKNLRSRISSYFQKAGDLDPRKQAMVKDIMDFNYIVTDNELEALALEANLIKQYKPRFNVILRDDKNYPYLKLTVNEEWPRLQVVRKVRNDGAMYFGPYVPSSSMREALNFIRRNFRVRPCRYSLDRPMRPCIQYQMGRCPAPCAPGKISKEEYMKEVQDVIMFLKGKRRDLLDELRSKMLRYSGDERYEDAARIRDRIEALKRAWESQKVISPELGDLDVIGRHTNGDAAFQVFFVRSGVMIGAREFYLRDAGAISPGELYHSFIEMFYAKDIIPPPKIVVDLKPESMEPLVAWLRRQRSGAVRIVVPRRGKERDLLRMADHNARLHYESKRGTGGDTVLMQLAERLSLDSPPRSIGAFDVSSIRGAQAVGAFIWWERGDFRTERYRHMKIRAVEGMDDYAMMRETIKRTLESLEEWPDLLVVDGGRGHLETAVRALREFENPPGVVSVAKKPDRAFTTLLEEPVELDDRSASSLLLRKIRDEVHRFAISFHKKLRGKSMLESPLESIRGIGKKRRLELLKRFKTVEAIRKASLEEIAAVPGMNAKAAETLKKALAGR